MAIVIRPVPLRGVMSVVVEGLSIAEDAGDELAVDGLVNGRPIS